MVYGDFECPYTAAAMGSIDRLLESNASFELAFRHFPLRSIHPHAQASAQASEAAARHGRFWELLDLLFRSQRHLETADLRRYAERLALDLPRFESDLLDPAIAARVERDLESGARSGVDGTPSLFIDGIRYRRTASGQPGASVGMSREMRHDDTARLALPVGERDHVQGPATASVTLVEYGDYECPYCRAAVAIVQELQRLLPDQLRFAFRHFPLENQHPHAGRAAEAAEAAAAQEKFFEMHAALFEHQTALEDEDLLRYAADLGLDTARFRAELDAHTHASRVRDDFRSGVRSSVRGTPTFYLDGVRYDGVVGVRQLVAGIRESHPDAVDDGLVAALRQRTIPRVVYERSPFRPSSG